MNTYSIEDYRIFMLLNTVVLLSKYFALLFYIHTHQPASVHQKKKITTTTTQKPTQTKFIFQSLDHTFILAHKKTTALAKI